MTFFCVILLEAKGKKFQRKGDSCVCRSHCLHPFILGVHTGNSLTLLYGEIILPHVSQGNFSAWSSKVEKSCMHSLTKPGTLVTSNSSPRFPKPITEGQRVTSWAESCSLSPATPHELLSTSCVWLSLPLLARSSSNLPGLLHIRQQSQADYTTNDKELL